MKRIIIITLIFLIILSSYLIFLLISKTDLTGYAIKNEKKIYTFTKAICNSSNYCQDYKIICENNTALSITPIPNSSAQYSENWKDNRDEKTRNKLCGP